MQKVEPNLTNSHTDVWMVGSGICYIHTHSTDQVKSEWARELPFICSKPWQRWKRKKESWVKMYHLSQGPTRMEWHLEWDLPLNLINAVWTHTAWESQQFCLAYPLIKNPLSSEIHNEGSSPIVLTLPLHFICSILFYQCSICCFMHLGL